jgi:hypothetical protein
MVVSFYWDGGIAFFTVAERRSCFTVTAYIAANIKKAPVGGALLAIN